jgi:CheY-like chemotaxis protein
MHPLREQHQMILVVAEDRRHRRLLRTVCARFLPCLVLTAADADTALTVARTIRLDLVLLDLGVPPAGGRPLVAQLQADPALAAIPVLLFTASPTPAGAVRAARDAARRRVKPPSAATWDSVIQGILTDPALARAGIKPAGTVPA